jgi:hypothetical protein
MYPWQAAALECGERYNNLVYCAPTSGGKSLVAEVLMIRRLLASQRDIPQPRRSKPVRWGGASRSPASAQIQLLTGADKYALQVFPLACAAVSLCFATPPASLFHANQPTKPMQKYGRALVVLPYVSIVCEKSEHLAAVLAPMRAAVRGFFGGEEGQALAPRCPLVIWLRFEQNPCRLCAALC